MNAFTQMSYDPCSWMQFLQLQMDDAWKIQYFNGVWTYGLAIPVQCSNQLSYEATDIDIHECIY